MNNVFHIAGFAECDIQKITDLIKSDKVLIMPSDTIYGFIAKQSEENRVRRIKHRDSKPFLYLISDLSQLEYFNIDISLYSSVLEKNWPGNITFIMANRDKTQTYGVRMPAHDILRRIIQSVGVPLLSTSVNVSGQPALNNPEEIIQQFADVTDNIIIDENYKPAAASTIVDLTGNEYKILRQGEKLFEK